MSGIDTFGPNDTPKLSVSKKIALLSFIGLLAVGCTGLQGPGTEGETPTTHVSNAKGFDGVDGHFNDDDLSYAHNDDTGSIDDPFEETNRRIFAVNEAVDQFVLGPVARGYGAVTPSPVKSSVREALSNLSAPSEFINFLLQGEGSKAGVSGLRFVVNSTVGVAGLFDVATKLGFEREETDFDSTLQHYGVETGPYVMLPLFGPSSARGVVGFAGDIFLDPLGQTLPGSANIAISGTEALAMREAYDQQIEMLREMSLDHYAAARSIYEQSQTSDVQETTEQAGCINGTCLE